MNRLLTFIKAAIRPLFTFAAILFTWQVTENIVNSLRRKQERTSLEFFIPSPINILNSFITNFPNIQTSIGDTLLKAAIGFTIGAILALIFAIAYFLWPRLRGSTLAIAYTVSSFPITGLAPVIVLAFGQGSKLSIVAVAVLVCYFPILISMDGAFHMIDKKFTDYLHIYGATRLDLIRYVLLPLSMPAFFVSLRLSLPASIVGAIIGEWMGANHGVGRLMILSVYEMKAGLLWACMFEVATVCAATALAVEAIGKKVVFWDRGSDDVETPKRQTRRVSRSARSPGTRPISRGRHPSFKEVYS